MSLCNQGGERDARIEMAGSDARSFDRNQPAVSEQIRGFDAAGIANAMGERNLAAGRGNGYVSALDLSLY